MQREETRKNPHPKLSKRACKAPETCYKLGDSRGEVPTRIIISRLCREESDISCELVCGGIHTCTFLVELNFPQASPCKWDLILISSQQSTFPISCLYQLMWNFTPLQTAPELFLEFQSMSHLCWWTCGHSAWAQCRASMWTNLPTNLPRPAGQLMGVALPT